MGLVTVDGRCGRFSGCPSAGNSVHWIRNNFPIICNLLLLMVVVTKEKIAGEGKVIQDPKGEDFFDAIQEPIIQEAAKKSPWKIECFLEY